MRLNSFHQRARLSAASAIDQLRNLLAKSAAGSVTQQLDLSELEDRILLSASPVAVMVESAPAAESVNIASPLAEESPSLFAPPQTAIGESPDSTSVDSLDQAGQTSGDIVSQPTSLAELDEIAGSILSESTAEQTATEVIFIDEAAEDFEQLIADLESQRDAGRAIDFFVLDSQQDGIDQIAETLARYSDLDAVHIVSHGTSGAVKLGATWLRIGSLDGYAGTIAGWGSAIGTDGDLLFYGCDLASNSRGEMLVDSIAALTGADVAASTDDTGHSIYGGDWELEYATGTIESAAAFSEETQQDWVGLLAVITVDTFNDLNDGGDTSSVLNLITTPGTDGISLREAIIATNADSAQADDIFFFSAGTYTLSLEGSLEELAATGDLDITDDLTIHGLGAASTIIDASGMTVDKDRVFDLFSGATVTISDVTIMNGGVTGAGVAGGAITVQAGATLTLSNSIVENNISNNGGAISNDGVLTVTDTIFRNNTATNGGAINNGGALTLTDVEFDGNTASNQGGGINTGAGATLNNVTFTGNSASTGGALRAFGAGTVSLTNVTMSGNSATNGGGIHTNKLIDATNITLVNTVSGGGILLSGGGGNVNLLNSILANNTGGNTNSAVTSLGYNIEDGGTAFAAMTGDQQNVAGLISQLGPLQNNGGFTKTHALLVGSQAIDPAGLTGAPATDQRGFTRDATPDIGAFEFVSPFTATSEFLVNTTVGDVQQTNAEDRGSQQAVSLAADGSYVVAWSSVNQDGSGWGVYARRLNSAGAALTGEVQVAQTTADNQQWARVASDDAGNFVVTWTSTNQDGTPQSVYARRFAADGTALTSEFRVHTTASGSQVDSAIAMDAVGNFVIAWEGNGPGDTTGVFARRFDSTGTPIDVTEFAVNTDTTGTQSNAAVAMNLAGEFVVIWDDANGVHGRHFDNAGTPQGPQFNIDSGNSAGDGAIAMDNAGGFVVVWRETTLDIGIHARRFDSLDTPLGISTIVNTTTFGDQTNPSITMDDAGDYIIVWEGVGTGDSDGVFARKYDSSGTALTGEFRVNDTTTNTQSQTSVAMLDVDNFVVVWSGEGAGDVDGVFARQFHHVPPVLDLDANNSSGSTGADFSANFTDGGGAVAIVDSDATLTDGNDTDLQSLTVTITDRQDGSNELLSANTAGTSIVASFNSFFGVLTLSSMDTVEHYEQVLRTVTYDNGINPATGPSRTITFVANDGVTNSNLGTTSLSINATPNQSPTADAGGPYVINEGGVLNLDGSASSDPDTDPLTFAWDLDNDGNFGEAGEPVTETPTVTWATLQSFGIDDDSGGPYTISLRVADGKGGFDTATTMLTVNNVAPTLSTTGTGAATAGSSYTLNLAASDPGADTISSWTINWGDGTIETIAGNPSTANHTYTATGFTFNILASATDEDGTYLQNELLVASSKNDRVLRYGSDAGFLQAFATSDGSDYPVDTIIGPDGNLYLSGWNSNDVLRYNATTGVFIDAFVSAGSGGLTSAAGLGFGLDGDLYVASRLTSEVLRFDGSTGAFIDAFVTAGSGGLDEAEGLTFGPNGDLYVSDYVNNAVYKYDGNTGVFDSVFVTSGSGGLDKAEDLVFGPDGNLYVADDNGSSVLRYNGTTGAFIDDFIPSGSNGLTFATGVDFGPDGNLYIGSWGTDNVLRFDGTTGAFIDEYISAGSGGLDEPGYFTFIPEHQVTVSALRITLPPLMPAGRTRLTKATR